MTRQELVNNPSWLIITPLLPRYLRKFCHQILGVRAGSVFAFEPVCEHLHGILGLNVRQASLQRLPVGREPPARIRFYTGRGIRCRRLICASNRKLELVIPQRRLGSFVGRGFARGQARIPHQHNCCVPGSIKSHVPGSIKSHVPGSIKSHVPGSIKSHVPGSIKSQLPGSIKSHVPGSIKSQLPGSIKSHVPGSIKSHVL